jgi:hypothetical protein
MKNQESMSKYRMLKIKASLARNMFLGSNMNFCMAEVISEGDNKNV